MPLLRWTGVLLAATLVTGLFAFGGFSDLAGIARWLFLGYAGLLGLTGLLALL